MEGEGDAGKVVSLATRRVALAHPRAEPGGRHRNEGRAAPVFTAFETVASSLTIVPVAVGSKRTSIVTSSRELFQARRAPAPTR